MKRGEESGYVTITLRGNTKEEKITITRKMDTHNKSEWLFNGKVSCIWSISCFSTILFNIHLRL